MGKFSDTTIKDIIGKLNESYFLPDIQRDYVWLRSTKDRKIENLFDSILRGYPIGSFLFWKLKRTDIASSHDNQSEDKLNFQLYKFLNSYDERVAYDEKIDADNIKCDDLNIVLDGQQRLTSLYIGLYGSRTTRTPYRWKDNPNAYQEKKLYLNLRYIPSAEDPDDNYKFEFFAKGEIPAMDTDNYWYKVGDILTLDSPIEYVLTNGLSMEEARVLERLKNAFCVTDAISYFTESEKNLDKVLKIFIRVNSGGTQLSYSDLLMSILTATFSSDIRSVMKRLVVECGEKGFAIMGRDQILKTCLLLTDCSPVFKLNNFNKTNIHKIESQWDEITNAIRDAIHLVKDFGFANTLGSGYIITTLALFLYQRKMNYNMVSADERVAMNEFVRLAQIKSYFSTSLDTKLRNMYNHMQPCVSFKEFNAIMAEKEYLKITADDITEMMAATYGSSTILPVLQILYPQLDYKNSVFHIDHIYPKSKFDKKNASLPSEYIGRQNEIFNLQLLQGTENIVKRDSDPEEWLNAHFVDDVALGLSATDRQKEYKRQNYIDENFALEWRDIALFEQARSSSIRHKLEELFLKS